MKSRILLAISLVWIVLFVVSPLIYMFILSFLGRTPNGMIDMSLTTENYLQILNPIYIGIFINSIKLAGIVAGISVLLSYPFAYFITKMRFKSLAIFLVMIPFFVSSLMRAYGIIILLQTNGVINTILLATNILQEPIQFMYNKNTVIFGTIYMLLPFMILPIYNSIDKLDQSLIEASYDLGAGKITTFFKITLPLTTSGIVAGINLVFIPAVGLFFISDLLGGAKDILIGNLIKNQFTSARNFSFGAALSVTMLICVVLCLILYKVISKVLKGEDAYN